LEYAISEWKVDIICMPFGCPRLDRDLHNTQKAIKKAHSENIIMLAAAANHGLLDNVSYPANQDEVICVGSTDGLGNRSHFTPAPEKGVHISVLGEAVPSDWQDNMSRRKSGTSFAVPIAAATASVIIDYLQRRGMSWTEEKKYHASKIKTRKGIVSVVEKHAAITDQGFCFLRPWKLFEKDFETIDHILLDTLRHV
jgi:subtilisin family serine protease